MNIALLGWGSLLWDASLPFDKEHGAWDNNGPILPLEFSRISKTRSGALTLVIDDVAGVGCRTSFAHSRRTNLNEALEDLRARERTIMGNIGYCIRDGSRTSSRNPNQISIILEWLATKDLDAALWTDLPSNFADQARAAFSVDAALAYLSGLTPDGQREAALYIENAPQAVQTPLRDALRRRPLGNAQEQIS